ncbi:Ribonuclease H domain [Dillenia turbinata]|uniref:Ribonuclease H domain n=1 Tax=Dillenia turbinata TaxID=194707 RepID=A0AAN8WGP8_9MAGN
MVVWVRRKEDDLSRNRVNIVHRRRFKLQIIFIVSESIIMAATSHLQRHFTENGGCAFCNETEESILHCLRDCPVARDGWSLILLGVEGVKPFWTGDTISWLKARVKGYNSDSFFLENEKFMTTIWILWKARCRRNFKNDLMFPIQVARWAIKFSREIRDAIKNCLKKGDPSEKSDSQVNDQAIAGGIFRNVRDSSTIVAMLRESCNDNHPLGAVLKECQSLMVQVNVVKICHTLREGNKCADHLAFLGHFNRLDFCELSSPPPSPVCFLERRCQSFFEIQV